MISWWSCSRISTLQPGFFQQRYSVLLESVPDMKPTIIHQIIQGATQARVDSFQFVWYSLILFAAVALLVSDFLHPIRSQVTRRVTSHVQEESH